MASSLSGSPDHNADYGRRERRPRQVRFRRIQQWLDEVSELHPHVIAHEPTEDYEDWLRCWQCCRYHTVRLYLHDTGHGPLYLSCDCEWCLPEPEVKDEEAGAPLSEEADRF